MQDGPSPARIPGFFLWKTLEKNFFFSYESIRSEQPRTAPSSFFNISAKGAAPMDFLFFFLGLGATIAALCHIKKASQ